LKIRIAMAAVALAACGGSASGGDQQLLDEAWVEIEQCVKDAGYAGLRDESFTEEEIAQGNPEYAAVLGCKDEVFARAEFLPLDLNYAEQPYEEWVAESWSEWKCLEESGYTRITPIPLMFEGGRPRMPVVTNFAVSVGDGEAVAEFYETAASCGDGDIERYKIQGRFVGTVDGEIVGCLEDNIGRPGFDEITGCFNVDEYPAGV
jgi:hypothetical protein